MAKKKKSFENIIESIRDKQAEIDDLLNDLEDKYNADTDSGSEDQDDFDSDNDDTDEEQINFFVYPRAYKLQGRYMINISILLPTRKRVETLKKSVESLIKKAKDPKSLQFLFAIDDDDIDTIKFLKTTNYPNQVVLTFKPMGYENIHRYNNSLALYAKGKWLMFFNDDVCSSLF